MKKVYKAYFPFNLILWIFYKVMCKKGSKVAMIDPFKLRVMTIGEPYISKHLYAHEVCHIEQVKRDGRFKFICKYLWYNIRYGYRSNPYEVSARRAALYVK